MNRIHRFGWTLTLLALAAFAVSTAAMAHRAAEFNRQADYPRFRIQPTVSRAVEVQGRRLVLTDAVDEAGRAAMQLEYGEVDMLLPVKAPPVRDMRELVGYAEWLSVQAITPVDRAGQRLKDEAGDFLPARYIIVIRHTPEGFDADSWGSVRRADWTFSFYELHADGTISHELYRFPRSRRGDESLARRVKAGTAKPHEVALAAIPPLQERTWQYQAALHVIPKLQVPKYRFENDAFGFRTMGWTLPGAGVSALILLAGLGLAFMPQRRR